MKNQLEKKYIPFNTSMSLDKRDEKFCYLRHNVYPAGTRGMYPSRDYDTISGVPSGAVVKQRVGNRVFVQDGADVKIYHYTSSSSLGAVDYTVAGVDFVQAVDGNDGVHWIADNGDVYKDGTNIMGALTVSGSGRQRIIFDGLYYFFFTGDKIYRQLKSTLATEVFGDTGSTLKTTFAHGNDVFFITSDGLDFDVNVWGKDSATLVDRRVTVHNARLLGAGSLDGVAIFVTSVGNSQNSKEQAGEIVVSSFDGEKLVKLNSIKAGESQIRTDNEYNSTSVGNGIMLVGVEGADNSHNTDLYHNYVYKIQVDGSIEAVFDVALSDANDIVSTSVQYDYYNISLDDGTFYNNIDNQEDYDSYGTDFTDTTYITNFLDFTSTKHKFGGIGFSFEKLFEGATNSENLTVSYRVSERDAWTEIEVFDKATIKKQDKRQSQTAKDAEASDDDVGLNIQIMERRKDIGTNKAFKEYYEIQFKLESKKGFSVIDFWYYTDATKRTTRG